MVLFELHSFSIHISDPNWYWGFLQFICLNKSFKNVCLRILSYNYHKVRSFTQRGKGNKNSGREITPVYILKINWWNICYHGCCVKFLVSRIWYDISLRAGIHRFIWINMINNPQLLLGSAGNGRPVKECGIVWRLSQAYQSPQ